MRISIIFFTLLFSLTSFAASEAEEVKALFAKYDQVMQARKIEFIDDVFTKKFLKESGGKDEFIEKVKELPVLKSTAVVTKDVSFTKGVKDDIFFAKQVEVNKITINKNPFKAEHSGSQFILVREGGKLKIDGTISDAN